MEPLETPEARAALTAEERRIEMLRKYKLGLEAMVVEARILANLRFATEEEAETNATVFCDTWMDELGARSDDGLEFDIQVSGPNIAHPNYKMTSGESSASISIDADEPVIYKNYPEYAQGSLAFLHQTTIADSDGRYGSLIHALIEVPIPNVNLTSDIFSYPLVHGHLTAQVDAPVIDGTHFTIPELEQRQKDMEIAYAIANSGLRHTTLIRTIAEIDDEMQREDDEFQTLENPDRLVQIARQTIDYVNNGRCSADTIEDYLMVAFKKGRTVLLETKPKKEADGSTSVQEVQGKIMQVFIGRDDNNNAASLNISVETEEIDDKGHPVPFTVAFDQLESFAY